MPATTGRVSRSAPALTKEAKANGGVSRSPSPGARRVMTVPATEAAPTVRATTTRISETRKTSTALASPPPGPPLARYEPTITAPLKSQPQNDSAAARG